jgi:hypothetical protein
MRERVWRIILLIWTAVILLPICVVQVFGCEYAPGILNQDANSQEYAVLLVPPDQNDLAALRQHVAFTKIFSELSTIRGFHSRGRCSFFASDNFFPNIRITARSYDASGSQCADIARDFLSGFTPDVKEVNYFASSIAEDKRRAIARPAGAVIEAETIQNEALKHIYAENSVMHALVSVGAGDFDAISASEFIAWLRNQRLAGGFRLTPLVMCKSDDDISKARPSNGGMPYSNIIPPQSISPAIPKPQSAPRKLSHAVMISVAFRPKYAPQQSAVERKYCYRENTFSSGLAGEPFAAWTQCLSHNVHNTDTWVTIFCNPKSCASAELAEKVAVAIANDSELVALGKVSALNGQARGPYLIRVEDVDK